MKKKLLFSLVLMVLATTALSAQEQEQTAAPSIVEYFNDFYHSFSDHDCTEDFVGSSFYMDNFNSVMFENNDDAEATIYYKYDYESDWNEYNGDLIFGGNFTIEAYAVADGKRPSEIVTVSVYYHEVYLFSVCVVDGIHYYYDDYSQHDYWYTPNFEASVCSRNKSQLYSPPYDGDLVVSSETVIKGDTYTVTCILDAAFASTFDCRSDIESVELPNTINEVRSSAFAGCTKLRSMTIHAVAPPFAYNLFEYEYGDENYDYYDYIGFDGNQLYDLVTLFVPNEALDAYRAHEEWGRFSRIVPFIGVGPGDINGDGNLSISDVTGIIEQLLSGENIPAYCDVNGDGKVSITDVTALIDMLLKGD